jgi:uncharacterized cupin superfamily protein
MTPFNLERAELRGDSGAPDGFARRQADIGAKIGGEHLGGSVLELDPGERTWPYHWEAAQEEWLIVLAGTPTVRTPAGQEELAPGDVVCFPAGPEGAHQVLNASGAACRVVMLSNRSPVNVVVYADSAKVGVRSPWLRRNFPDGGRELRGAEVVTECGVGRAIPLRLLLVDAQQRVVEQVEALHSPSQ